MGAFAGWPSAAVDFYDGLEEDNSKSYWTKHKPIYDSEVRAPMDALLASLADEFGAGKVFRPYRDVRFSADKSHYKTHIGAVCTDADGRVNYVQFSAAGLRVGGGAYEIGKEQLERVRRAIADDRRGKELEDVVATMRAQRVSLGGDTLKTAPRGFERDHPRIELLRHKSFYGWREWDVEPWLATAKARDRVVETWRACRPLHDWLRDAMG